MLVVEPIPGGDDYVALDALGTLRLGMGQLSFGDAVCPLREMCKRCAAELLDGVAKHSVAALPRLNPAEPRFLGIGELAQRKRHVAGKRAHGAHADRMTVSAAVAFHEIQIFVLS